MVGDDDSRKIPDDDAWRLFAAVPVGEDVKRAVGALQRRLRHLDASVRWVDPSLVHLTIKFFGNVRRSHVPRLSEGLASAAAAGQFAALATSSVSGFPSPERARVIWVGVTGEIAAVTQLADAVRDATAEWPADGKFAPHLTVGRARQRGARVSVADVRDRLPFSPVTFAADRVQLIRSVLGPGGPRYTTVGEWRLSESVPFEHT